MCGHVRLFTKSDASSHDALSRGRERVESFLSHGSCTGIGSTLVCIYFRFWFVLQGYYYTPGYAWNRTGCSNDVNYDFWCGNMFQNYTFVFCIIYVL